ncbi:MAG: hypothetical protein AAGI23_20340 [Bacteroidota bacterium]
MSSNGRLLNNSAIFYFNEEKIDGYWQFAINTEHWYFPFYRNHIDWTLYFMAFLLLVGIIRNPKNKIRQLFLLFTYIVFLIFYYALTVEGK